MKFSEQLQRLFLFDPVLAEEIGRQLEQKNCAIENEFIALLVDETLWGMGEELSFGRSIASGYASLIGYADSPKIEIYRRQVRRAGKNGPTLGKIIADHLAPVIRYGDGQLVDDFLNIVGIMQSKGTYTLRGPLESLDELLQAGDVRSSTEYLFLLGKTFSYNLTYSQSQHLSALLPKAVLNFNSPKRPWQIAQLNRVVSVDYRLVEPLIDGLGRGLDLLSSRALERFVGNGLQRYRKNHDQGVKYLALNSKTGADACDELQVAVSLAQVQSQLNRYLQARTHRELSVRPISSLPKPVRVEFDMQPAVCSDGKYIYLPDEIAAFPTKAENVRIYKTLVGLESAFYEFDTFEFDLQKIASKNSVADTDNRPDLSDYEKFLRSFPVRALAADLFAIFELARIRIRLEEIYPGLVRRSYPLLRSEIRSGMDKIRRPHPLLPLFRRLALNMQTSLQSAQAEDGHFIEDAVRRFNAGMGRRNCVETSAGLAVGTYGPAIELLSENSTESNLAQHYQPIDLPFGWQPRPEMFYATHLRYERTAERIWHQLAEKGVNIYKSDLRRYLLENRDAISLADIWKLSDAADTLDLKIEAVLDSEGLDYVLREPNDSANGPVFRYAEWNANLDDYVQDHVLVRDQIVTSSDNDFYRQALDRYHWLLQQMRRAFELLKPEGLKRLRCWLDGDEFDYRALLDYALDRRAGILPSDRLYIKRIKEERDVAVLLLVDVSRSTSSRVADADTTVLEVEKEALVIFCEALDVLGDAFAIAAFSGTGRLGVDYLRIKDFDENLSDTVKNRISNTAPQRNTRMGAAIRHATRQLENSPAKVRLLITLGDGFPNDVGYKQQYAVADTRKALFELHSKNMFAHAITVNIPGSPQLDDLFGNVNHTVISDVRELPGKLLRVYGTLTKN